MTEPTASGSIEIAATPDAVFGIISDPLRLTDVAAETVRILHRRASVGRVGSRWVGLNRHGWRVWPTTTRVTDAEQGRRFAFEVGMVGIPVSRWQYDIEASGDGVRVTEAMWDRRPDWFGPLTVPFTGVPDRVPANTDNIARTLAALKATAEAEADRA